RPGVSRVALTFLPGGQLDQVNVPFGITAPGQRAAVRAERKPTRAVTHLVQLPDDLPLGQVEDKKAALAAAVGEPAAVGREGRGEGEPPLLGKRALRGRPQRGKLADLLAAGHVPDLDRLVVATED